MTAPGRCNNLDEAGLRCALPDGHTGDHSITTKLPDDGKSHKVRPAKTVGQHADGMITIDGAAVGDDFLDEELDAPERQFGRPTKFKPEYTQKLLTFFRKDPVEKIETLTSGSNGKGGEWSKTEVRYEALTFPTLELFADSIDVHSETLLYWASRYPSDFTEVSKQGQLRHPDFSAAYTRIKELQKGWLLQHSLTGKLNSGFAQFFAINNLGMQSKSVVENMGEIKHSYEELTDEQLDAAIKTRENRTA